MNSREAITGFAAWLTCRDEVTEFGSTKNAAKPAELVDEFCNYNNLPEIRDELWTKGVEFEHPPS